MNTKRCAYTALTEALPSPHDRSIRPFNPRKMELEIKEKRDAIRLETTRRAKHEAEARAREQNAQRQLEAERRREHERLEKEIKDCKDREEKEARRRKAAAEDKAKAMREVTHGGRVYLGIALFLCEMCTAW